MPAWLRTGQQHACGRYACDDDAAVSILVIAGLLLAKVFGWRWMDPLVGIVGSLVIASWAFGLIRDTGAILLDMTANRSMAEKLGRKSKPMAMRCQICISGVWGRAIWARSSRSGRKRRMVQPSTARSWHGLSRSLMSPSRLSICKRKSWTAFGKKRRKNFWSFGAGVLNRYGLFQKSDHDIIYRDPLRRGRPGPAGLMMACSLHAPVSRSQSSKSMEIFSATSGATRSILPPCKSCMSWACSKVCWHCPTRRHRGSTPKSRARMSPSPISRICRHGAASSPSCRNGDHDYALRRPDGIGIFASSKMPK